MCSGRSQAALSPDAHRRQHVRSALSAGALVLGRPEPDGVAGRPNAVKLILLPAALLMLVSCSADGRVCGLVGPPPPGVTFDLEELAPVRTATSARLCAGEVCKEVSLPVGEHLDTAPLAVDPRMRREGGVPVSLELRPRGAAARRATGTAVLRLVQPNGPGCDPEQWSATVVLEDGRLQDGRVPRVSR